MQDVRYLTVTALTKYLKSILENNDHLKQIYIKGEISNLTKHSRGHFLFHIKRRIGSNQSNDVFELCE